ncbi:MAG: ATP-dependent Clp protease ATP-binding subunit [Deltaproteobacteria bacterium]|nr:ATP-dependent Clp protease ATP-binding subunit [Deltaproteobacteria bacterium]
MEVRLTVYHAREGQRVVWVPLGLGAHGQRFEASHENKLRDQLTQHYRELLRTLPLPEAARFELTRGARLVSVRVDLTLQTEGRRRKLSMSVPLVLLSLFSGAGPRVQVAFHPLRQGDWFAFRPEQGTLVEHASGCFSELWADVDPDELDGLRHRPRSGLRVVSFNAALRSILDTLRPESTDPRGERPPSEADLSQRRTGYRVLPRIGENLTRRAIDGDLPSPEGGSPVRERLRAQVSASPPRSVVLIGPSGSGRTTALRGLVHDLLAADDFSAHQNADAARAVWRVSGTRIIAGMSFVGDWEERCGDVLADVRARRALLAVDDLHQWGRIGRSRDSDRNIAEFFRAPVSRGECVLLGECTVEQWRQLEEDAPAFAASFTRVAMPETSSSETLRMLLQEARALELTYGTRIPASGIRTLLEVGGPLFPHRALPGRVFDLLHAALRDSGERATDGEQPALLCAEQLSDWESAALDDDRALDWISARTGFPRGLLHPDEPMSADDVRDAMTRRVLGQAAGVESVVDLAMRMRRGLTDPKRPLAVYLFTGPTGTGKTELARAMAAFLYSSPTRLLRLDMGEYATPDAAARLIGDRWAPEGLLTRHAAQQPFGVVLFDEIEKAHPQVHNLLLQLFDEGRLTDAGGVTADFTHSIIVMTSNLGARRDSVVGVGSDAVASTRDHLRAVQEFFPPELFNRIDRVVAFSPLTPEVARVVAARELGRLAARQGLVDRGVFVSWTPAVLDRVVSEAFRAEDGARSLKRYLEDRVGTALTDHLVRVARADLTLLRVDVGDAPGSFSLQARALHEADPIPARYPLEELIDADRATLARKLREAGAALDGAMSSPAFSALSERIHDRVDEHRAGSPEASDALFHLDALRARGDALHEHLASLSRRVSEATDWELTDVDETGRITLTPDRVPMRAELLSAIAEVTALTRSLREVDDPTQHSVIITLTRLEGMHGGSSAPGLLEALAAAYGVARGSVESAAATPAGTPPEARRAALRLVGLSVRAFFEHEQGVHLWHTPDEAPELVVVRVRPARSGETAADALSAIVPETGEALRVVRSIRYDPTRRPGPLSLEDYVMGTARVMSASSVTDPLPALWMTRMAREEVGS